MTKRFGWMQDMHFRPPGAERTDAASIFQSDYNDLVTNKNVDEVFLTGDQVHPDGSGDVPHIPESAYNRLWDTILGGTVDGGDAVSVALPGNHDIPIQTFVQSDPRATLRKRVDYPGDNLTVLFVNTQAASMVTGSRGNKGGVGETRPRVPRADLEWIDRQLADAGSNAKLVVPHAPLYPTMDPPFNGNVNVGNEYEYVSNWETCHEILSSYNKVVSLHSHYFNESSETSDRVDGVEYVRTIHYSNDTDPASPESYGYVDIDGSGCTVTTENSSSGTVNTNLGITF